jgi:4-amino-4-deoxy-L-arabinose transferase-like glycosyltransferase
MDSDRAPGGAPHVPSWASPGRAVGLLIALAIPLYFVKIGSLALLDPDEPYYAVPALEMLRAHSWAVPLFRGEPWFDKPVLFYWIVIAGYKLLGVTEAATRIGSAIAGTAGAIALAILAPSAWRARGAHVLGAIVLATSLEYAFIARAAVTDMTLTLFLTLGFLFATRYLERGRAWEAGLAGAAFGLAVLTKGPVGALIPVVALGAYGVWMRRRELIRPAAILAATAGFLVTAAPWYAYMAIAHRDLVVKVFLGDENLGRFLTPEHRQMPFFYLVVFAIGMIPWSAALVPALWGALKDAWRRDDGAGASPGPAYAIFWFGAVVGVFSLSASKLLTYVLPAFPPAAYLVARWWGEAFARGVARGRPTRGTSTVAWIGAAIAALAAAAIVITARTPGYRDGLFAMDGIAAVLTVGGLLGVLAVRAGRLGRFVAVQSAIAVVVVVGAVVVALPRVEAEESTRGLVRRLESEGIDGQVQGTFRVPDVSLDFYLGRTLERENDPGRLADLAAHNPSALWVFKTHEVDAVAARAGLVPERVVVEGRRTVVRLTPKTSGEAPGGER